jgi:hypothetical protein
VTAAALITVETFQRRITMTAMILLSEWQSSQVEFWLPIPNYSEYDASNFGNIRSWRSSHKGFRRVRPRYLKPFTVSTGYRMVKIYRDDGELMAHGVHRLVALAFIDNPEALEQVNHLTGRKDDCRVDGLEWKSRSGNGEHAWRVGLIKDSQKQALMEGSRCARKAQRTISEKMIRYVRELRNEGLSYPAIEKRTGIHFSTARSIALRIIYKDV